MIIMDYGGRVTLAFAITEQYDYALCQHNATGLVSLLVDFSKSRKTPITVLGLVETEVDRTLYCCSFGESAHAKKYHRLKQMKAHTVNNPKRKPIVTAKDSTKKYGKPLPKQLKCSHYG